MARMRKKYFSSSVIFRNKLGLTTPFLIGKSSIDACVEEAGFSCIVGILDMSRFGETLALRLY
jgi:hypothetical protein